MDNLTKTIGLEIRDKLRTDSTLLTLLGLTTLNAKNHIFYTTPAEQTEGFKNPRIVIESLPSDSTKLSYTDIFQGNERFQLSMWVNSLPVYSLVLDALDRIVTLFNKKSSTSITNNVSEYTCTNKNSLNEPDKDKTKKGELTISLNIGNVGAI